VFERQAKMPEEQGCSTAMLRLSMRTHGSFQHITQQLPVKPSSQPILSPLETVNNDVELPITRKKTSKFLISHPNMKHPSTLILLLFPNSAPPQRSGEAPLRIGNAPQWVPCPNKIPIYGTLTR
jgi:hypothetical protein